MERIKVGYLPLYIKLYDDSIPPSESRWFDTWNC